MCAVDCLPLSMPLYGHPHRRGPRRSGRARVRFGRRFASRACAAQLSHTPPPSLEADGQRVLSEPSPSTMPDADRTMATCSRRDASCPPCFHCHSAFRLPSSFSPRGYAPCAADVNCACIPSLGVRFASVSGSRRPAPLETCFSLINYSFRSCGLCRACVVFRSCF